MHLLPVAWASKSCLPCDLHGEGTLLKYAYPPRNGANTSSAVHISCMLKECKSYHSVASQVVHPTLEFELHHDGVYPGVASACLIPGPVEFLIDVPVNLFAELIAHHLVKVGRLRANAVKELAP